MPSSFSIAIGIFLSLNISSADCQEAAHRTNPALRTRRLRHNNNFNGRHVNTDNAWHRLAQEDLDHGDGDESIPTDDDDSDGGTDFVDLLRQTEPQYLLQQQQEAIDEMLTLALSDISVAFNSLPPQTAAPTTIGDPAQSRNRTAMPTAAPTTLSLRAEDDLAVTVQDQPVDINVLGNDFSAPSTTIDDGSKNATKSNNTDPGDALSIPSDLSPTLNVGNFTQPLKGEAVLNSDGATIRYTPSTGYTNCPDQSECSPVVPADCFEYEACQETACVWAEVCVEVTPSFIPQPRDDVAITPQGEAVTIDALANDIIGVTERPIVLVNVTQPTNGTARIYSPPNGTFSQIIYSPFPGYSNCPNPNECSVISPLDCFEYQVCDAEDDSPSLCAWANVCVEVIEAISTSAPSSGPTTSIPTAVPTTTSPTLTPTLTPTLPCDMTPEQRAEEILFTLVDISSPALLSDPATPQGRAFRWLVDEDAFYVCPSDNTCDVIQRFVLAVIYFSTNGPNWFQCSGNRAASDDCGNDFPFDQGQSRFLAPVTECNWAGIRCSEDLCVTEIEFELNNLVGTIPDEIGNLPFLEVLGMERGGLSSTIPSVLGQLTNLYFLDLDYNAIEGSLPSEISRLTALEQLDLNNNRLTGSIDAIHSLTNVFFLQLHNNQLSGTIPERLGAFAELGAATLHSNQFVGSISPQICALRDTVGGPLMTLTADCDPPESPEVVCTCCTECRSDLI